MCNLSNFYRLLEKCLIKGIPFEENSDQPFVHFDLAEFINDSNDEIYHAEAYQLSFLQEHFNTLFDTSVHSPPLLKILVVNCVAHCRESIEEVLGCDLNVDTGELKLQLWGGQHIDLNLSENDEFEGKIVQLFDIENFLEQVNDSIFIGNHWITAIFFDSESKNGVITDDAFMKKFGVQLTP